MKERLKGLEFESYLLASENKEMKAKLKSLDNTMKQRDIQMKTMNDTWTKLLDDRKRELDGFVTATKSLREAIELIRPRRVDLVDEPKKKAYEAGGFKDILSAWREFRAKPFAFRSCTTSFQRRF